MNDVPQELNWVRLRAECSINMIFEQLIVGVEEDCKVFNEVYQSNALTAYRVYVNSGRDVFGISCELDSRRVVKFYRGRDRIEAKNELTQESFTFTLTLDDEGRCKLKLTASGEELEQWQIRRRALEGVLFSHLGS